MSAKNPNIVTAAALAIGDELLSGRTRDKNIGHLANALTQQGIELKEVRIVSDDEAAIVEALNALRAKYTYVFTSGGIGPTHDDITADAIAKAFGVAIDHDPRAMAILEQHYDEIGLEFTTARKRMARIPEGADLIQNNVSKAPGFQIGNVFVMAGVPSVFQAMLESVLSTLEGGARLMGTFWPTGYYMHLSIGAFTKGLEWRDLTADLLALAAFVPVFVLIAALLLKNQEA